MRNKIRMFGQPHWAGPLIYLSDIQDRIKRNLSGVDHPRRLSIGVSSSLNLGPIAQYLRYYASASGVDLEVFPGTYDNPVDDMGRFATEDLDFLLLAPSPTSTLPAFATQVVSLSTDDADEFSDSFVSRWLLAAASMPDRTRIVLCLPDIFHFEDIPNRQTVSEGAMDVVRARLRRGFCELRETAIVDLRRLISILGERSSSDRRLMFRARSPYSLELTERLAYSVWRETREFGTRYPKALVLDADNTLWGGVVGESGPEGVELDPFDFPGNVFWWVQNRLLYLQRMGVLLCLATKNESVDVESMLEGDRSMILRSEHFVAIEVGWDDKPSMLRSIADRLNIGLDSMAFLDDSSFEVEAVREQMPEVSVFQVPMNITDYPLVIGEIFEHFAPVLNSETGSRQTALLRNELQRSAERSLHATNLDYLRSLGIRIRYRRNDLSSLKRMSELTLKTNQFNLAGRRMSEAEIRGLVEQGHHEVWTCFVADKFGESGLTGLAIVRREQSRATIEDFLLSCRVLGRGVETALLRLICAALREEGVPKIYAHFIRSPRNAQTSDFYPRNSFEVIEADDHGARYVLELDSPLPDEPDWIEVSEDVQ